MVLQEEGESRDSAAAARQAGWQFGIMTCMGLLNAAYQTSRPVIAATILVAAALAVFLCTSPARIWSPHGILAVTVVLFVSLGVSTWSSADAAMLTALGFLVAYVWMGLHQGVRAILLSAPFVLVIDVMALSLAGVPPEQLGAGIVGIPIAVLVALVISTAVTDARRVRAAIRADERWRAAIMATLAHDVRSPLTSIVGVLEIMEDDPRTPDANRALLQGAHRQAERILRLSAGLLEVERVDQGRLTLDRRHLLLADLLDDIAMANPALQLTWDVRPDLTVWADRERLEQILMNLASNAARHGAPPVDVSATSDVSGVSISVRDHGAGVPEQDVQDLFERLSPHGTAPQSVGLGLWIVRLLTEAHGGSVRHEPADPGARFVVRLPAATTTEPPAGLARPSGVTEPLRLGA